MAEPVSLAFAAITAFKEIFLISCAVYKIIRSSRYAAPERLKNCIEFHHELLFLRDFGRRFLLNTRSSSLDTHWLQLIEYDLQQLQKTFNKYQALAARDPSYQRHSPLLNDSEFGANLGRLSLEVEPPPSRVDTSPEDQTDDRSSDWWTNTSAGLRWVFHDRRKFEKLLQGFKDWNSKLKEIGLGCMMDEVMLTTKGQPSATSEALHQASQAPEEKVLGLAPFLSLKQLSLDSASRSSSLEIEDALLHSLRDVEGCPLSEVSLKTDSGITTKAFAEFKEYGDLELDRNVAAVNQLASLLAATDETDLNTLPFHGYVKRTQEDRGVCAFVFKLPEQNSAPPSLVSLQAELQSGSTAKAPPLGMRFALAECLAKTIWRLHTVGWIHKSIRSSNIILLRSPESRVDYSSPYVVGFEYARLESDATDYTGFDEEWSKNIYRHPARQGSPTTRFSKAHDLYALGLVLLEVGLWRTLADILAESKPAKDLHRLPPKLIMEIFQSTAATEVAHRMGGAYAQAVMECLSPQPAQGLDSVTVYENVVRKVGITGLTDI